MKGEFLNLQVGIECNVHILVLKRLSWEFDFQSSYKPNK